MGSQDARQLQAWCSSKHNHRRVMSFSCCVGSLDTLWLQTAVLSPIDIWSKAHLQRTTFWIPGMLRRRTSPIPAASIMNTSRAHVPWLSSTSCRPVRHPRHRSLYIASTEMNTSIALHNATKYPQHTCLVKSILFLSPNVIKRRVALCLRVMYH